MITFFQTSFFFFLAIGTGAACAFLNGGLRHLPAQIFHAGVAVSAFAVLSPLMLAGEPATVLMAVSGLAGIVAFASASHLTALAQKFGVATGSWRVTPFSFACAVLAGAACGIASLPALACGLLVTALIFVSRTDTAVHGGLTPDMPGVGVFCTAEQRAAIYPAFAPAPAVAAAPAAAFAPASAMAPAVDQAVAATPVAAAPVRKPALVVSAAPVAAVLVAANDNDAQSPARLA